MSDIPKQIERALFDAALNLPNAAVRKAFLEKTCAGDANLRGRLEELLDAHAEAEWYFDLDPVELAGEAYEPDTIPTPVEEKSFGDSAGVGVRIGRYKLIERMGEGGCGVVYLAEQKEPVQRRVALKIIRLGMDTERVIARFEMERQALALMNHPNIAQVLDAGATETGGPYFVMELVPGVRITDYCDQHQLDIPSRLELFIEVCQAIQHAHQKGILHRDIKPSNILVMEHGEKAVPKVIDFGIAKAIEGPLGDKRTVTAIEQFIGTPAYMSPEQAETGGLDVDTRSDIYSLGALLYELLTGRPPFNTARLVELGVEQMRRELIEKDPPRPSKLLLSLEGAELAEVAKKRRCEPARLIAGLKGDLDWIVMKAMEKDRQRRYATVNGLAVDVQRYLRNQPVSARPPSRWYLLGKLVRRNRVVFAAGAAVAAALIIGLGTSTVLFFQEREARQQQAKLLAEAEKNEVITRAVFLLREGKPKEADAVLEQVHTPPQRPSFDSVWVFRSLGDWLAMQQKWQEAARRYTFLMHLDQLDIWGSVTLDYQAYAVLLLETGDFSTYAQFCRTTVARYAGESNGDAASRILKSCLLRPPSPELMTALRPLAKATEGAFAQSTSKSWAAIPVSLWHYRCGDDRGAAELALPKEEQSDDSAATATGCAIRAMALFHQGKVEEARGNVARARKIVDVGFTRLRIGNGSQGYWYDWVFARILLREAESTIR
ncbi:MAG TPA: serine/threonine-protein kinase [Chthoniobacterales bacterium]